MRFFIDVSDDRNLIVKKLLSENKFITKIYDKNFNDYKDGDVLIFSPAKKFMEEEVGLLPENVVLFAGSSVKNYVELLKNKNIRYVDIMNDEIFTIKNANLTAEGVLGIIIARSEKSMFENNVLLLGSGRISKACAILFSKLGIKYAIASYSFLDYQRSYSFSDKCFYKEEYFDHLNEFDIVVNTRPFKFIDDILLNKFSKGTLFIETASVECLNKDMVKNFDYYLAPALPTKYTPETAGKFLYERIMGEING